MDLALGFDHDYGRRFLAEKVVDHIGHAHEAVYATQSVVDMFMAEAIAY